MALDPAYLAKFSKHEFKKIVKKACKQLAFDYLLNEKSKLSKGKEIIYSQFEMQKYFKSGNGLNIFEMQSIFCLRSWSLPIKCNFSFQYSDRKCVIEQCTGEDSQRHLYYSNCLQPENTLTSGRNTYDDIFTNNPEMQIATPELC